MMEPGQYLRNHEAISKEEQQILAEKRVLVAGCGGLGGYVIENLGRVGVGHLSLVDGDVFEESNLNRQLLSSHMNIGRPKVLAAKQRMQAVNPHIEVDVFQTRITAENALELMQGCDLIVDCLDNIPSRKVLQAACEEAGLPLVHGAVAGWRGQVCVILPGERSLDILYPNLSLERGEEAGQGTLSFTAATVASIQASLVVNQLLGKKAARKTVLLFDLRETLFQTIELD
jgi:molybdopterin/thiamine biosynthesis adenylyltransferase